MGTPVTVFGFLSELDSFQLKSHDTSEAFSEAGAAFACTTFSALRRVVLGPAVALAPSHLARRQLVRQFAAEYSVQSRLARQRLVRHFDAEYFVQHRLPRRELLRC